MIDSFETVDEMLDADNLGRLIGREVLDVSRSEMRTEGFSENAMQRITCSLENGADARLVLKQFDPDDWLMKLSADTQIREISFLESGLYADLPAPCSAPAIAATRDANGAALLMWDISEFLFAEGDSSISEDALEACVGALASLHSHYWDDQSVSGSRPYLCSIDNWINLLSPNVGRDRVNLGVDNDITSVLEDGWAAFAGAASPIAARTVSAIHANPETLLEAFESSPRTLIHGDVKLANLGIDPSTDGVMMLDWTFASFAPALVELGWFLAVNSARLPVPKETVIHMYREMLASKGVDLESDWQRSLDLGLLAGGTLRLGWAKAFGALSDDAAVRMRESAEIEWWSDATERASLWLG
jgi:thiamine kinase-like enzyme